MDSPEGQREEIARLRRGELAEGQAQFLVSARWWRQFAEHVQLGGANTSLLREAAPEPPPIDNADLLADGAAQEMGVLRENIQEGQDYEFLPERAWNYLHGIYKGPGPALRREVIARGAELVVERYPLIVMAEALDQDGARVPDAAAVQTLSREMTAQAALKSLAAKSVAADSLRLWAHRQPDLALLGGEAMSAATLRGWQRVLIDGAEARVGELQCGDTPLKDGQTLLLEQRHYGAWNFEAAMRRAAGSAHWKEPATDALEVDDRVDFDVDEEVGGEWLSAVVVGVREGEVQLCCPGLVGAEHEDALAADLARMNLSSGDAGTEVADGPATPWVKLTAGRMAKWHTHELPGAHAKRQPFGPPRDLRTGDKCEVERDGVWSSATVEQVDWAEMTAVVKTGQGQKVTVGIDGDDLAKPGSMIGAAPAVAGGSGTAAGGGAAAGVSRYVTAALPEVEELNGICGLSNLGNTCFMNSALQALSNTPSFRDFFTSGVYKADINTTNLLGTKGRLASEFGKLMEEIWSNRQSSTSPSTLKRAISDSNPMFAGYQQHDSHELLSFLLDAIHEDLNRVIDKPATEAPESDGTKDDEEVAEEAWEVHLKRNRSVVVDHFQGQLRSEAACLACGRVSVKFDESMYLSVPLPQPTTKTQQVTVVRNVTSSERSAAQTIVDVPLTGVVGDMRAKLVEMTQIPSDRLFICEVYQSRVYKILTDTAALCSIQPRDIIFAYEMDETEETEEGEGARVQILNRKPATSSYGGPDKFAYPLVLSLPTGCTHREVRAKMQALGNSMLKAGQADRFLRKQEASELELEPALVKAKELIEEGEAKLGGADAAGAIGCFTDGVDTLAAHVLDAAAQEGVPEGEAPEVPEVTAVEQSCLLGRAAANIALAEAEPEGSKLTKMAFLRQAVTDCELVLNDSPENVRALYLRGRAGAVRADELVQLHTILRELRYAKGLLWKAGELDREDQKIEQERDAMNNRLHEKEEEVNAEFSGGRGQASNVLYVNKRSFACEVHWVRKAATEEMPIETKKMASVEPEKDYRCSTKMGVRFVVYEAGGQGPILHDIIAKMKPNTVHLHEDEEAAGQLNCKWLWESRGGATPEEVRADAVGRPSAENESYALVLADPSRADKGKPLPNDDEVFTADFTLRAVCIDWTAAGLEARDNSRDKVRDAHFSLFTFHPHSTTTADLRAL